MASLLDFIRKQITGEMSDAYLGNPEYLGTSRNKIDNLVNPQSVRNLPAHMNVAVNQSPRSANYVAPTPQNIGLLTGMDNQLNAMSDTQRMMEQNYDLDPNVPFSTTREGQGTPYNPIIGKSVINNPITDKAVIDRDTERDEMELTLLGNKPTYSNADGIGRFDTQMGKRVSFGADQPVGEEKPTINPADLTISEKPTSKELGNVEGDGKQGDSEEGGMLSGLTDFLGDEQNMLNLALAFNTMRLEPDQQLASVIGKRLESVKKRGKVSTTTYKALLKYDAAIAEEYLNGNIDASKALDLAQKIRRLDLDESEPAAFRSLKLRAQAAGLKEGTEAYQQFMVQGGAKKGLELTVGKDGTVTLTQGGAKSGKAMSEASSNALQFAMRMEDSGNILNKFEQQGTQFYQSIVSDIPLAGNYLRSAEYQQYDQAKRNFINATLRKESGAAIAASEFENAEKQYFPQPGDSAEVIAQKRRNREMAMRTMAETVPGFKEYRERILKNVNATAPIDTTTETKTIKQPKIIKYNDQGQRIN